MAKFKVGDKVRVRKDLDSEKRYQREDGSTLGFNERMEKYRGNIYRVRYVYTDGDYELADIGDECSGINHWFFCDAMLEPCGFTKADLKNGMVIEFRDNKSCPYMMVVGDELRGPNGWEDLNRYGDDLKFVGSIFNSVNDELTIDKVYTTKNKHLDDIFNAKYFELVWDRPCEIEYVEMTVEEIEKKLGHKIKVVGSEGK